MNRGLKSQFARLVEQLGREIRCQICLCIFEEPQFLPCSHSFCELCIRESLRMNAKCPLCRTAFNRRTIRENSLMAEIVRCYKDLLPESLPQDFSQPTMSQLVEYLPSQANTVWSLTDTPPKSSPKPKLKTPPGMAPESTRSMLSQSSSSSKDDFAQEATPLPLPAKPRAVAALNFSEASPPYGRKRKAVGDQSDEQGAEALPASAGGEEEEEEEAVVLSDASPSLSLDASQDNSPSPASSAPSAKENREFLAPLSTKGWKLKSLEEVKGSFENLLFGSHSWHCNSVRPGDEVVYPSFRPSPETLSNKRRKISAAQEVSWEKGLVVGPVLPQGCGHRRVAEIVASASTAVSPVPLSAPLQALRTSLALSGPSSWGACTVLPSRMASKPIVILTSGLDEATTAAVRQLPAMHQGPMRIVSEFSSEVSHLIVDTKRITLAKPEELRGIGWTAATSSPCSAYAYLPNKRTMKVMQAMAWKKWVLSTEWVWGCISSGVIQPELPYEISHYSPKSTIPPRLLFAARRARESPKPLFLEITLNEYLGLGVSGQPSGPVSSSRRFPLMFLLASEAPSPSSLEPLFEGLGADCAPLNAKKVKKLSGLPIVLGKKGGKLTASKVSAVLKSAMVGFLSEKETRTLTDLIPGLDTPPCLDVSWLFDSVTTYSIMPIAEYSLL